MAEWVQARADLHTDPVVVRQARTLGMDAELVAFKWVRVWAWAREHTADGFVPGVTFEDVDSVVGVPGFCAASVRWAVAERDGVMFPKWEKHNTNGARERWQDSERKKASRRRPPVVRSEPDTKRTESGPEEKRREERDQEGVSAACGRASPAVPPTFQPHAGVAIDHGRAVWDAWCAGDVLPKTGKHTAMLRCREAVQVVAAQRFNLEACSEPPAFAASLDAARDWLVQRVTKWRESPFVRQREPGWNKQCIGWMDERRYDDDDGAWNATGEGRGSPHRTPAGRPRGPNPNGTAHYGGAAAGADAASPSEFG